jgi:hypothetical protein
MNNIKVYDIDEINSIENSSNNSPNIISLTNKEKLLVAAKIRGMSHMPVDIETFIKDPYYLGESVGKTLFPFWLDKLKQIYPNPIMTKYPYISLGGAIGELSADLKFHKLLENLARSIILKFKD